MKIKNIFDSMKARKGVGILLSSLVLSSSCFVCTSCEDMFTAENQLVTTNLAPQDTIFQMLGLVKRMQKLATRTILFGEVRADLVTVNPTVASTDVQQLYSNEVSEDNAYNKPADYYDVINNCNIYLAGVDSLQRSHGRYVYEREVCAAKSFRAWCYLELAKIYGSVPFVTEPVLSEEAAEKIVATGQRYDMVKILDFCIKDLEGYAYKDYNNGLRPKYGNLKYWGFTLDNFFIPVRVLLGEMYLWRGSCTGNRADYINAIRMYHDYLCFTGEERATGDDCFQWLDRNADSGRDTYYSLFLGNTNSKDILEEYAAIIPCDTIAYYGTTTELKQIFNSQYSNNYYPWVSPSQRLKDISAGQDYCFYDFMTVNGKDTVYMPKNANYYSSRSGDYNLYVGDLRLSSVYYKTSNADEKRYHSNVNEVQEYIAKWLEGSSLTSSDRKQPFVPFYRHTILYLHLAEALNRAGLPETAYAILTYGLTYNVMNNRNIISQHEFDQLCEIKSYGLTLMENKYDEESEIYKKTRNSAAIWPSNVFANLDKTLPRDRDTYRFSVPTTSGTSSYLVQIGIHSRGCGDTEVNAKYYLDDEETKNGLVDIPEKPKIIPLPPKPNDVVGYESWLKANKKTDGATSKIEYNNYLKANTDSLNDYVAYPDLYYQYKKDSTAYQDAVNANLDYLASDAITAKRQARVAKLILDEEALEGSFEGYRFYDIMRYQRQEGKFNPSTITLPEYIAKTYTTVNGATPWKDNMTGKPWFIPLPKR